MKVDQKGITWFTTWKSDSWLDHYSFNVEVFKYFLLNVIVCFPLLLFFFLRFFFFLRYNIGLDYSNCLSIQKKSVSVIALDAINTS